MEAQAGVVVPTGPPKACAYVVRELLAILPDTTTQSEECWDWCWDELSDAAQEKVKAARRLGGTFLETGGLQCKSGK